MNQQAGHGLYFMTGFVIHDVCSDESLNQLLVDLMLHGLNGHGHHLELRHSGQR